MLSGRFPAISIGPSAAFFEPEALPRGLHWPRAESALPHLRSELRTGIEAAYADLEWAWRLLIGLLPRGPEDAPGESKVLREGVEDGRKPVPGVPIPVEQTVTECLEVIVALAGVLTDHVPGVESEPAEHLDTFISELEWMLGCLDLFRDCRSVAPPYRARLKRALDAGLRTWPGRYAARAREILAHLGAAE